MTYKLCGDAIAIRNEGNPLIQHRDGCAMVKSPAAHRLTDMTPLALSAEHDQSYVRMPRLSVFICPRSRLAPGTLHEPGKP